FGSAHRYKSQQHARPWAAPRVGPPAQSERWGDVVASAHDRLALARPLAAVAHRPWEARAKPITPQQVRRAPPRRLSHVGTPARPPRPRGKAPGRARGTPVRRAPRRPVIRETAPRRAA